MDQDLSSAKDFLERQVALMHELAGSLERAQAAVLNSDVGQLRVQTLRQQKLCEELRRPASEFSFAPSLRSSKQSLPQRRQLLLTELRDMGKRVEGLNRDYSALLRRARRTVDIFCRVLASSGLTYLPPTRPPQSALQDLRE